MENKDSTRTKKLKEAQVEDDFMGIKKAVKAGATKASEMADRMGFTQEKEYKKEPAKKAKGGSVKYAKGGYVRAADGCAVRGKTKGKMV